MTLPKLHTTEAGAEKLGLKPRTLRRLAAARRVDVTMVGGEYRWTDAQLAQVIEVCTRPARGRGPSQKANGSQKSNRRRSSQETPSPAANVGLLRPDLGGRYAQAGVT